tara:strand:+ start:91 stop:720 length:630 start_codon:yes stop_codon:yes gene_type:complete
MINKKICGVILTGGLSSRMGGGIKSLLKFNNISIFDRIFEKINNQVDHLIINSNDTENSFDKYNVDIVQDNIKGFIGPLAGIHASMKWIVNNKKNVKWLCTIPCDTPFIPEDLVDKLFNNALNNKHDIVLARSNTRSHPIVGIWKVDLINNLEKHLINGTRKIMDWASIHSLGYEDFNNLYYDPFFNINNKNDISKAEKIEKNIKSKKI